jgi:hypothetical protein
MGTSFIINIMYNTFNEKIMIFAKPPQLFSRELAGMENYK